MSYYLTTLPLWVLIVLIVGLPTAAAMIAQVVIHARVGVPRLAKNNEIAGFKFATIGVIYAVLLAFAVIVVWEKFSEAQNAVAQEGAGAAALFRYAEGNEPEAYALKAALIKYLRSSIAQEWPKMEEESESHDVTASLSEVYRAAMALNRSGARTYADMTEVFAQFDNVTTARRIRLHLAIGLVPNVIWIVLFAGGFLTIGFTLFFGSENLPAQVAITGALSVLVTMGLVVIVSIDHPFTGPIHIRPHPLEAVLAEFETP